MSTGSVNKFQNVSRPRFYVDYLQYLTVTGNYLRIKEWMFSAEGTELTPEIANYRNQFPIGHLDPYTLRQLPSWEEVLWYQSGGPYFLEFSLIDPMVENDRWYDESDSMNYFLPKRNTSNYINYVAALGHTMHHVNAGNNINDSITMSPYIVGGSGRTEAGVVGKKYDYFLDTGYKTVLNAEMVDNGPVSAGSVSVKMRKNGFSIFEMNDGIPALGVGTDYLLGEIEDDMFASGIGMRVDVWDEVNGTNIGMSNSYYGGNPALCSLSMGRYYDMPVAPDMTLTFSREMDGVENTRTRGGSTVTNIKNIGPPAWGGGDLGPGFSLWNKYITGMQADSLGHLGTINGDFIHRRPWGGIRVGRRKWSLRFSMLSDDNVMGAYESFSQSPYDDLSASPGDDGLIMPQDNGVDIIVQEGNQDMDAGTWNDPPEGYIIPILEDDNFYSQVFVKTLGGRLPFLFNPRGGGENPDNSPDQFAICTIDQKSISFRQVSHRLYQVSLTIVETW